MIIFSILLVYIITRLKVTVLRLTAACLSSLPFFILPLFYFQESIGRSSWLVLGIFFATT